MVVTMIGPPIPDHIKEIRLQKRLQLEKELQKELEKSSEDKIDNDIEQAANGDSSDSSDDEIGPVPTTQDLQQDPEEVQKAEKEALERLMKAQKQDAPDSEGSGRADWMNVALGGRPSTKRAAGSAMPGSKESKKFHISSTESASSGSNRGVANSSSNPDDIVTRARQSMGSRFSKAT